MKTTIEELENNQVKLTVTVEAADVDKAIAAKYKDFANRGVFPGFRKGKVPRPVIDGAFGGKQAIMAAVTEDVINETFPVAADEANLFILGQAQFGEDQALVAAGEDFVYTVTVNVEPKFELNSYEPVAIELPSAEVTEDEITKQVEELCSHYMTFEDAAKTAKIADGNRVTMKVAAKTDGGMQLNNLTSDEFAYTLGSGLLPETFDRELVGLKAGAKKSFEINAPVNTTHYLSEVAGMAVKVLIDVEILGIKAKVAPALTDAWVADTFGVDTVDELRKRVADMIADDKQSGLPRVKEDRICAALRDRLVGEPSAAMVNEKEAEFMQNFFSQLQRSGMTFDSFLLNQGLTAEQFKNDVKQQATDSCKENLALDAWARNAALTVSDEEITAEFVKANAEEAAELEAEWRAQGQIHTLRQSMLRVKALDNAVETAVVTEEGAKKPAKKAAAKKTTKKAAAEAEAPVEAAAEATEAPAEAPKKKAAAKKTTKKAAEAPAEAAE